MAFYSGSSFMRPARQLHCVNLSLPTLASLREHGYSTTLSNIAEPITAQLRAMLSQADIVLVDVSTGRHELIEAVRRLRSALCSVGAVGPILCFSSVLRNPHFVVDLCKIGVRYARIGDAGMLMESTELLLAEIADLQSNGPCFRISHWFSRIACGPGEVIASVQLYRHDKSLQLPLSLSQRLFFNLLAENKDIALDAFQIVAGLNGRFYREHGLNAGMRQAPKVKVPTIKVLAQRLREAMASVFAKAHMKCDPYNVLRSFPVEGSNRVSYRLHADVRWEHKPL